MIYTLKDRVPQIDPSGYVAPSADIIGSVHIAPKASVWFNAVLRGDNDLISIGARSNVQDCSVLHVDPGVPIEIGEDVTIGHSTMLHGCTVGNNSLIGIGSVILNHASIGSFCIVGANSLVTERKQFPSGSMIMGSPAKVVRELTEVEMAHLETAANTYVNKIEVYRSLSALPTP